MVLAIEPMVNLGRRGGLGGRGRLDGADAGPVASAHFEHTVAVEPQGAVILGTGALSALRAAAVAA